MWDDNDKRSFTSLSSHGVGQIRDDDSLGNYIRQLCLDSNNTTFLEIGTWNGLGSTKIFVDSLTQRKTDFIFYSLECNTEKALVAKELYKDIANVHILNETICAGSQPLDFYDIFPECINNKTFEYWNSVDVANINTCELFLNRKDLPPVFDVLLLDGGEFTTYYEFQILKDRCRYILLDDTLVSKCKKIAEEIKASGDWTIMSEEMVRNGYLVAKRN